MGGVIYGEGIIWDFGFVETQKSDALGVWAPPQCIIASKYFFFVYPVWDAEEEGGVPLGGDANWFCCGVREDIEVVFLYIGDGLAGG